MLPPVSLPSDAAAKPAATAAALPPLDPPGTREMSCGLRVAPKALLEFSGIRPGEKLHEQMISEEDAFYTYEYTDYFKILPAINGWSNSLARIKSGVKVAEGFCYTSNNNPEWMSETEFQAWMAANADGIGKI